MDIDGKNPRVVTADFDRDVADPALGGRQPRRVFHL